MKSSPASSWSLGAPFAFWRVDDVFIAVLARFAVVTSAVRPVRAIVPAVGEIHAVAVVVEQDEVAAARAERRLAFEPPREVADVMET